MKVVGLYASPRKNGNSAFLADRMLGKAEAKGASVRRFYLNKLSYGGCQGCMICKKKQDSCVLKDDLTEVLEAVSACDVLVLASPVYWCDINAQLKTFVDRTYSFLVPDYLTNPRPYRLADGKKLVLILTQGGDETLYTDIHPRYQNIFRWLGFAEDHLVRACSVREKGEAEARDDLLSLADGIAENLF